MLGRRKEKEDAGAPLAAATLSSHKRLGELLLEENLITRKQLEEACAIQEAEGGFLGHILVKLGYVTQNAVASCLVKQCKIPHLSLLDYDISMEVLRLVPEDVCRKYHVLPIDKLGRILTLAMVDPLDLDALEEVRRACPDLRIKPILCNWEHFEMVARRVFGRRSDHGGASVSMSSLPAPRHPHRRRRGTPLPRRAVLKRRRRPHRRRKGPTRVRRRALEAISPRYSATACAMRCKSSARTSTQA